MISRSSSSSSSSKVRLRKLNRCRLCKLSRLRKLNRCCLCLLHGSSCVESLERYDGTRGREN